MSGQTVGQSAPVASIAVRIRDLLRRVTIVVLMLFASVHAVDAQPAVLTGLGSAAPVTRFLNMVVETAPMGAGPSCVMPVVLACPTGELRF